MNPTLQPCIIPTKKTWTQFEHSACPMCRTPKSSHGRYDEGIINLSRFLHTFPDLREVFLVFPWHPYDRLDGVPGKLYCATGQRNRDQFKDPAQRARRMAKEDAAGREFRCGGGGVLREPTRVLDKHAAVVDAYHWWFNYAGVCIWSNSGSCKGFRKKIARFESVEFRILIWTQMKEVQ